MGEKEWHPDNVLDIFGDPVSRAILVIASEGAMGVPDIADRLDVSDPTIYRRIDPLVEANLLEECRCLNRDENQQKEYETILDEVTLTVENGSYTVDIRVDQNLSDDFESLWSDLESTTRQSETDEKTSSPREAKKGGDPL